jgi:hypothetical protein
MRLKYNTLRRAKEAEVWIDTAGARDIARNLKLLITQAKNGVILDTDEQIIWDIIKAEIESHPEKEYKKQISKLEEQKEALETANRILREKVKQITTQLI